MTGDRSEATAVVLRAQTTYAGKQATVFSAAISAESVGSRALCMHMVTIPPGARAKAHKHESHETAVYVLQGRSGMWYGERLEQHLEAGPGDFVYIPAGMPHQPYNLSDTEPVVGIACRTDPNEQESVILLPELDGLH